MNKDLKRPAFENAIELAATAPDTFKIPEAREISQALADFVLGNITASLGDGIRQDLLFKVLIDGERFWVKLIELGSHHLVCEINNEPMNSIVHGLEEGDLVVVLPEHILSMEILIPKQ